MENAGTAEILRAAQKDTGFVDSIKSQVADIFQKCFGSQLWLKYNKYIGIICEMAYYSLTTLSLRQTLGEEYTGLLMISKDKKHLPTLLTRVIMICLQCLGPTFIRLLISKLDTSINSGFLSTYLRPKLKNDLLSYMPALKAFPSFFLRLHLATFYLRGYFYHFSKRLTGTRYVLLRSWFGDKSVADSFRVLGSLLLFNIVVVSLYSLYESAQRKKAKAKDNETELSTVDPALQCPLCLGKRSSPSLTPCGHLFCWNCIHESLLSSNTCPLCRHQCAPNQIVPLMNYI